MIEGCSCAPYQIAATNPIKKKKLLPLILITFLLFSIITNNKFIIRNTNDIMNKLYVLIG